MLDFEPVYLGPESIQCKGVNAVAGRQRVGVGRTSACAIYSLEDLTFASGESFRTPQNLRCCTSIWPATPRYAGAL